MTRKETDLHAEAAFWNNLAEEYAAKPVDLPDAFERKIAITKSNMRPDDVVLDIGCGTGSLALRLAPNGARIHGLDISREMIRIANSKAAKQDVGNVAFHVGKFDESFTVFEPESLDGICAYSILHLVDDLDDALARIHGLLKPGGYFISSTVVIGNSWVPYGLILPVMKWVGKAPYVAILSTEQLKAAFEKAGFVDLEYPDVGAKFTTDFIVARKPR